MSEIALIEERGSEEDKRYWSVQMARVTVINQT
jgi:hypothetical protein